MTDFVLMTGDTVNFDPTFGQAIVVVQPGTLNGTGKDNVDGKPVCVEGDEATVKVLGCACQTPQYSIPGVGMLSIASLGADQTAKRTKAGGKAVLLKGSVFNAKFEVMVPAQQPHGSSPTTPDSTPQYSGTGSFVTTNMRMQGT